MRPPVCGFPNPLISDPVTAVGKSCLVHMLCVGEASRAPSMTTGVDVDVAVRIGLCH